MRGSLQKTISNVVSKYRLPCAKAIAWGENRWSGFVRSRKRSMVSEDAAPKVRVFQLLRDEDPSGVSGVGRVAVGAVFPSGKVVLEWLGSHNTFGIYDDLERVQYIHGHGGKTRIVFTTGVVIPYSALLVQAKRHGRSDHALGA